MPRGRPPPRLASAGRRWVVVVLLLSVLQRLEVASDGATPASPFPPLNKLVGDVNNCIALFCSSPTRSGRHGGEGWWVVGGSGGARRGRQDLRSLHAGVDQLCLCRGPWWAICWSGSAQMQSISGAAMNFLFPARLGMPIHVLAGHGGEETGIGDASIWEAGGGSAWTKHQFGNLYMAASFCCCDLRSVGAGSSYVLSCYLSGCHAMLRMQIIGHDDYAFLLFGTCRRRVRASLQRFLRFNGKEPPDLSSVLDILDLQLNLLPHMHLSTRLLVEPLALRLTRLREAPKEYDCRFFASEFSTDPLAGSGCALYHNHHVSLVLLLACSQLDKFVCQDESCNLCVVTCYTI